LYKTLKRLRHRDSQTKNIDLQVFRYGSHTLIEDKQKHGLSKLGQSDKSEMLKGFMAHGCMSGIQEMMLIT